MMKKNLFAVVVLLLALPAWGQRYTNRFKPTHIVGLGGGVTYYYGDLEVKNKQFFDRLSSSQLGYCAHVYYAFAFAKHVGLRLDVQGNRLNGNDGAVAANNRSFSSLAVAPSLCVEYAPISVDMSRGLLLRVGAGGYFAHVSGTMRGTDIDRQMKLPLLCAAVGWRFALGDHWKLELSAEMRQALIDSYRNSIDGFPYDTSIESQSSWNDDIFAASVGLAYQFGKHRPRGLWNKN